ncbi:DUF4129 domain-containing protein [Mycolicibacterium sp. S3B2]|uniref:DUF4129 domain-containing protein n=1 Tax=Mycolicibacterium sp. S3B2 TaxID=3415120 RepID=UPI003C7E2D78
MPGDGRTVARTITVIVLVLLATVALGGYLPGAAQPDETQEATEGSGSLIAVVAMLVVSMAVIALSLLKRPPPRRAAPARTELPNDGRGYGLPWRPLLLAAAALLIWLTVLYLLLRWAAPPVDPPPPAPGADPALSTDAAPPTDTAAPERRDPAPDGGSDMFAILAVTTLVLVVLTVVAAIRGRRRPANVTASSAPEPEPSAPTADPDLARAAELGLAEIGDLSRDPRQAIIACYAAMERELGKSPGASPQDSDTPTEVLARAIDTQVLRSGSAGELVDLFEEARFSAHIMDEGHRAEAVRALQLVQRELAGAP